MTDRDDVPSDTRVLNKIILICFALYPFALI